MIKRYDIIKNEIYFNQVDSMSEMYNSIGMTRQQFNHSIKGLKEFTFKGAKYEIIDKLLKK